MLKTCGQRLSFLFWPDETPQNNKKVTTYEAEGMENSIYPCGIMQWKSRNKKLEMSANKTLCDMLGIKNSEEYCDRRARGVLRCDFWEKFYDYD